MVKGHRLRTTDLYIYIYIVPLGKGELRKHRRSGCHTVPKGVTGELSAISIFWVGKIIAVYSDNNYKHLNNSKTRSMHGFSIV